MGRLRPPSEKEKVQDGWHMVNIFPADNEPTTRLISNTCKERAIQNTFLVLGYFNDLFSVLGAFHLARSVTLSRAYDALDTDIYLNAFDKMLNSHK